MQADKIFKGFENWMDSNISVIADSNPFFYLFQDSLKDVYHNILNEYKEKIECVLCKFADKDGMIDINKNLDNMLHRLNTMPKSEIYTTNSVCITGEKGNIIIDYKLPFIGNKVHMLTFNKSDIDSLKNHIHRAIV